MTRAEGNSKDLEWGGRGQLGSQGVRAVYQGQSGTDTWEVRWEPSIRGQGTHKNPN